jgi:hypothetical protein
MALQNFIMSKWIKIKKIKKGKMNDHTLAVLADGGYREVWTISTMTTQKNWALFT